MFFFIRFLSFFSFFFFIGVGGVFLFILFLGNILLFDLFVIFIIFFVLIFRFEIFLFLLWLSLLVFKGFVNDLWWFFFCVFFVLLEVWKGGFVDVVVLVWMGVEGVLWVVEVDLWGVWVWVFVLWIVRGWLLEEGDLLIFKGGRL